MLPRKLAAGQPFKTSAVKTINEIIDYLKTQRVVGDNKTIRVNQFTSGLGISLIPQPGIGKGGADEQFKYPFKMSIVSPPEDEGGGHFLSIQEGRIQFYTSSQKRCYVSFQDEENRIDLSPLSEIGSYVVMLVINVLLDGGGTGDNSNFEPTVCFMKTEDANTANFPFTRGIFSIPLGYIEVTEVETEESSSLAYTVTSSDIIGNFVCNIGELDDYFSIVANVDNLTHGEIYEGYNFENLSFEVRPGLVYFQDEAFKIEGQSLSITENSFVYLALNEAEKTFEYKIETEEKLFFDEETKLKYFEIGQVSFNTETGIDIFQSYQGFMNLNGDTYKLKICEEDAKADFMQEKLVGQEPKNADKFPLSSYTETYVGYDIKTEEAEEGTSGEVYSMVPVWMWKEIKDFDEDKKQGLTHDKGSLKWAPGNYSVSGSLAEWMKIDELSGENALYWKPEFDLTSPQQEKCYIMASVNSSTAGSSTLKSVISGISFGDDQNKSDAIMTWNLASGMPEIKDPPSNTTQVNNKTISSWVLAGCQEDGLAWVPLEAGAIELSGSLENHFEVVSGADKSTLIWKDEFDQNAQGINYIITQDHEGKFTKATWTREGNEKHAVMLWNFDDSPAADMNISVPPPATNDHSNFILAGNETSGLAWVPYESQIIGVSGSLADIIELAEQPDGTKALQVISEYDGSIDQFSFLILDEMGCIDYFSFYDGGGAVAGLMVWDYNKKEPYITVPPAAVEDDHWFLEGTQEDGVGWTSLGESVEKIMLAKLVSQEDSIQITQSTEYEGSINLDINPAYFFSSDDSISIEQGAEGGLDFTVNVVAQLESPDESIIITPPTEGAEDKTIQIEINPDYFTSSDNSIAITDANEAGGLDFTVNVTTKIESPDESLIVTLPEEGAEDKTIQIEINPDYFTSSDNSIAITDANEAGGLDFTVNVTTQLESPDESIIITPPAEGAEDKTIQIEINPDYFTSSDNSISITDANEAGGLDFTVNVTTQLESPDESLIITPPAEGAEDKTIQIKINPDYFTSSDNSIAITDANEAGGLDFTVNVTTQLESPDESLIITLPEEGAEDKTIQIEINAQYFTSSDESIAITDAGEGGGLDFTVNAVTELESPDESIIITPPAEGAEDKITQIEINPDYFTSSDESIIITDAGEGGGLDFTVNFEAKFESPDESIIITPPAEGAEDKTTTFEINTAFFTSSDESIAITDAGSSLDFTVNTTVKIESPDESLIVTLPEEGAEDKTIQIEINADYFTSSDESIIITDAGEGGGLDFTVNTTTKLESPNNSITITEPTEGSEDKTIKIDITPEYFTSNDQSVIITAGESGIDFSVEATAKLESEKNSIIITEPAEGATDPVTTLDVNPAYFTSSDQTVDISDTGSAIDFIIPDLYKVKVSESDTAPDYLPSKLVVDASAAGLIQLVVEGNTLKIKSALTGNGLMVINNGNVSVLAAPTGNAVLVCKNGQLSWVEYNDCENACS